MSVVAKKRTVPIRIVRAIAALVATALLVVVPARVAEAGSTCFGHAATIVSSATTIHGTPGDDVIVGGGASQVIYAGGGNDIVCAGGGNDRIYGQGGNDQLHGQVGNDVIQPGHGNDYVTAGSGNDRIIGSSGANTIHGGSGRDSLEWIGTYDTNDTVTAIELKRWTDGVASEKLPDGRIITVHPSGPDGSFFIRIEFPDGTVIEGVGYPNWNVRF